MKRKFLIPVFVACALATVASPIVDSLKRRCNRAIAIAAARDEARFPGHSNVLKWQQYSNLVADATNAAQLQAVWTNLPPKAWEAAGGYTNR